MSLSVTLSSTYHPVHFLPQTIEDDGFSNLFLFVPLVNVPLDKHPHNPRYSLNEWSTCVRLRADLLPVTVATALQPVFRTVKCIKAFKGRNRPRVCASPRNVWCTGKAAK